MKDLSFFLLKNSVGAKMKKGIRNSCNDDGSTSTLNQNHGGAGVITPSDLVAPQSVVASNTTDQSRPTTLEEMILRNALNQSPRFSLDGKDSMYRSSFRNPEFINGRNSVCCDYGLRERVVAKLMGLEAVPVTISRRKDRSNKKLGSSIKRQNLRRRAERHEVEQRLYMDEDFKRGNIGSCSNSSYFVMKPTALEPANGGGGGWPTRRFH
ncbi:Alpha/beta-Hydrolases superfamily protein isoform 1 [Hibiscus syriacus]|uniref:Alpha/beta-Hydrolases superfamily protein isoform 1 n=1 Tax=Hibiscus syriacus TaxID=106335 RepID=A0A6A3BH63_HIBSY|nr:Alpha/beta-Hydrolases superfamily protein isoform 1 [Hibiscus syriacus]